MTRYLTGNALQIELATEFGIERRTVGQILKRHGVAVVRGLSADQVTQAEELYARGDSLGTIGKALGVDAGTVRARLLERGVSMRDSHGRARE